MTRPKKEIPKVVLVQFRDNPDILDHELTCVARDLKLKKENIIIYNAIKHDLSGLDVTNYDAFVFGGSGKYNISTNDSTVQTIRNNIQELLKNIIKKDIPSFFICLGFHLLSDHLGESVKREKERAEIGTCEIKLTEEGQKDNLFSNFPKKFKTQEAHNDSIANLPKKATLLATNDTCQIQAYKVKENIYATQFHPELQKEDMFFRLSVYGKDYDTDQSLFKDTKTSGKLLYQFRKLVIEK